MSVPLATEDVLLLTIALSVVSGAVVGALASVPLALGFAGGTVPASGVLGYAQFVDPPT